MTMRRMDAIDSCGQFMMLELEDGVELTVLPLTSIEWTQSFQPWLIRFVNSGTTQWQGRSLDDPSVNHHWRLNLPVQVNDTVTIYLNFRFHPLVGMTPDTQVLLELLKAFTLISTSPHWTLLSVVIKKHAYGQWTGGDGTYEDGGWLGGC